MFDLTKEIKLEPQWQKKYNFLRLLAYALFFIGIFYFSYLILFPSKNFTFSFRNPNSPKNTVYQPRTSPNNILEKGKIKKGENIIFDGILPATEGRFTEAEIEFEMEKNSSVIYQGEALVRKSYQAFFYPEGEAIGFKDGSLIKNKGDYYLVSQGKLRKFSSFPILGSLGYSPENFEEVSKEELNSNPRGEYIVKKGEYPDDTLIKIGEDYYKLKNQKLYKFISSNAYLSQYLPTQALEKNGDFLKQHEMADEILGFAEGTLISSSSTVFLVSNNEILPVDSPQTFELMGFNWKDVMPASGEEIGIYQRGKLFNINRPHPNGTIFAGKESGKYYLIQNNQKREIKGQHILKSYLKKNPVLVDERGLETADRCFLKKEFSLFKKRYACAIDIKNLGLIVGTDYQFEAVFDSDVNIKIIGITFKKELNWDNFKLSVLDIINKIKLKYGKPQPTI